MLRVRTASIPLFLALALPVAAVTAQTAPIRGEWQTVALASGVHANPTPVAAVVWRDFIFLPQQSPWLRVYFKTANLEGDSYLRIASMLDGDVQTMHQKHLLQWDLSTAYFNGNAVMIELVAAPGTSKNFVSVERVMAGQLVADIPPPETICGATDDRVPSSDARAGRILGVGCSGWIIAAPTTGIDRLHLSAGHCFATGQVLQFNVPASSTSCALVNPPASFQFAIDSSGSVSNNGGIGNDYWVFRCFANSNTGLTTFQTMNAAFTLATSMPATGTTLVNWGYGLDGTPTNGGANSGSCGCASPNGARNQTQQTHTGPLTSVSGTQVFHQVDTCGGNSGSVLAINATGVAMAIHTNAGCTTTTGSNSATAVTNAGLQSAIALLASGGGPTPPANDNCNAAIAVTAGTNGPFSSQFATPGSAFVCVASGSSDVWFSYQALASGVHTFATCSATRNFDTTLEVFSGTCAGLTSLACNDDTCGLGSQVSPTLVVGQTYLIHVGGFSAATGSFDLDVSAPAVAGDECVNAIPVVLGTNGPFNNTGTTQSLPAWPCGFGTRNDKWFAFTASCTAPTTFRTCTPTRTVDTVLEVFSGTCAGLTSLGCNDDFCDVLGSSLTVSLVSGQTYLARVSGYNNLFGAFDLVIQTGTGAGTIVAGTTLSTCQFGLSLSVTGNPNIGNTITETVSGATGIPAVGWSVGANIPMPTPCPVGCVIISSPVFAADGEFYLFTASKALPIPCSVSLIGAVGQFQGFDFFGASNCVPGAPFPAIPVAATNITTVTVG